MSEHAHTPGVRCTDCAPLVPGPVPGGGPKSHRSNIGDQIVDGRQLVYGDTVATWTRIAQMWSAIIDAPVSAFEAALCMDAMKTIRATAAPDYSDNLDDKDGYVRIARDLVGSDMINAQSVDDYLDQKYGVRSESA